MYEVCICKSTVVSKWLTFHSFPSGDVFKYRRDAANNYCSAPSSRRASTEIKSDELVRRHRNSNRCNLYTLVGNGK